MKFTDYITWLILCVGVCIGCSDKEEVVPSDLKDNYFAVPDDATDPESLLRKSFKQETGIHLLFNDTLANCAEQTVTEKNHIWWRR